jgi:hypothetical protein
VIVVTSRTAAARYHLLGFQPESVSQGERAMASLKVTSWNIEHFRRVFEGAPSAAKQRRREAISLEVREMNPDILCVLEGPRNVQHVRDFAQNDLGGDYAVIEAADGQYATSGEQWIWFLARQPLVAQCSLLPVAVWDEFAAGNWPVHYWGVQEVTQHRHYRHPQVLVMQNSGLRVEFIGLHLKSKYVNQGESMWNAGGAQREEYVFESIKARIKLATEAENVRRYLDAKFEQVENPAIFVMGDLNDGPGRELFESEYLFFDLVSNLQGDVFFARKFLNHALFDYTGDLRWSARFDDFVENVQDRPLLIDHIMFTQGLVNQNLPLTVEPHAGLVEHEIHELVNAPLTVSSKTSDHRPVSVYVTVA